MVQSPKNGYYSSYHLETLSIHPGRVKYLYLLIPGTRPARTRAGKNVTIPDH
jgi:hypothetical protein